jgi:hypothetical protein
MLMIFIGCCKTKGLGNFFPDIRVGHILVTGKADIKPAHQIQLSIIEGPGAGM